MEIGIIGLGKMGGSIAKKLRTASCQLSVYDANPSVQQEYKNAGFNVEKSINDLSAHCTVIWVMVPQSVLDTVLGELCACTVKGTIVIDGGNSFFKDSIRRYNELDAKGLAFLDCGTSGGLWGAKHGFSMTIGGKPDVFKAAEEVFKILATSATGYLYTGPAGSGHYVKMVHNGIEYALLEGYAEGFHILHDGYYKDLDLAAISQTWQSGAIIRSWILELAHDVLVKDQDFQNIKGSIGENGTGKWTVEEAQAQKIPVPVIKEALLVRNESRKTGGNYTTKLVSLLRHVMGGHPVAQKHCETCQEVKE